VATLLWNLSPLALTVGSTWLATGIVMLWWRGRASKPAGAR
jgi:hypothetical protein